MDIAGFESPEELEQQAFERIGENKLKEGLRLLLKAAKGYEEEKKTEEAARLYRYLGYLLLKKTSSLERARPSLLKSAYLYIDMIEKELLRPQVNLDVLDEYCSNVLEIFRTLNDSKNLVKYAEEFAAIYEDIGNSYQDMDDIEGAIKAYESAYRYYRIIDNVDAYRRVAEVLITLYGNVAEKKLEENNLREAAEIFYRLSYFIRAIFGYDIHFIEMMDTAAKNFEKASKVAYSRGDLDETTSCLVKAQYSYLLAKNFNRAKLIGINTARMLHQVINSHRANRNDEMVAKKLVELSEALVGLGKIDEAMRAYKTLSETRSNLMFRVRIRTAVLRWHASIKGSGDVLDKLEFIDYYSEKGDYLRAIELAEEVMDLEGLGEILDKIHNAEGIY